MRGRCATRDWPHPWPKVISCSRKGARRVVVFLCQQRRTRCKRSEGCGRRDFSVPEPLTNAADVRSKPGRFPALDALRSVLALWVTVGHLGIFPLFVVVDRGAGFGHLLTRGWNTLVWGVPAVIGCFVISGFCIHLPFLQAESMPVGRYYARRYLRILVPVAAAILINQRVGVGQPVF